MTQTSPHMTTRRPSQRPAPTASPAAAVRTSLRQAGYAFLLGTSATVLVWNCLQARSLLASATCMGRPSCLPGLVAHDVSKRHIGLVRSFWSPLWKGIACLWPHTETYPAGQGIRNAIMAHTNQTLPDPPPQPRIVAYGDVALTQQATLLDSLDDLFPGLGIYSQVPMPMEEYGQG